MGGFLVGLNNMTKDDQSNKSKWVIAILLFLLIPPAGVIYIWVKKEYFFKKLYLFLWFFGGWSLFQSLFFSTMILPKFKNTFQDIRIEFPSYLIIVVSFMVLLSMVQIIFGFLIDKKQSLIQPLSKGYFNSALILLVVGSIIIPLIILIAVSLYMQQLYSLIGSIK